MKKIIISILIVLLLGAGVFSWIFMRGDKELNADNSNINTKKSSQNVDTKDSAEGKWENEKQDDTFAGYEITEKVAGQALSRSAVGKTKEVTSSFDVNKDTLSNLNVSFEISTVKSDSDQRDMLMRTRGIETEKFPTASFEQSDNVTINLKKDEKVSVEVPGEMTFHGQSNKAVLTISLKWDSKVITLSGDLPILLSEYGIELPNNNFLTVEDNAKLKFQLLFVPKS